LEIYTGFSTSTFGSSNPNTTATATCENVPNQCLNGNACVDAQQMDIYRDLILRHLIQDISTTCAKLGLPTDAQNWTQEHGSRWISEMCQQFNLTSPRQTYISGRVLLSMSQKDFVALAPEGGDTLYAQLQLWKTEYISAFESYHQQQNGGQSNGGITAADNSVPKNNWILFVDGSTRSAEYGRGSISIEGGSTTRTYCIVSSPLKENIFHLCNHQSQVEMCFSTSTLSLSLLNSNTLGGIGAATQEGHGFFGNGIIPSPSESDRSSNASMHDTDDPRPSPFPRHSGTVHLWHFIRELLDHPNKQYGSCVRWVDRDEGTFKIESSHHLARFWGQRKNRAQMNYDKLSRSLRQYYKKGIIQKPEKKQRLVYKFLPPYNL
ncbi:hypothetical protein Angca_006863, partial [Angiostrongylus cantonensis]